MSIAIHGDNVVDGHFKNLTEDADRILNDLNILTEKVADIQDGRILDKKWNMYLINQSKANLDRALPVFEKLVEGIKDKIRIRNEQSSIFRAKRDAELQELEDEDGPDLMEDESGPDFLEDEEAADLMEDESGPDFLEDEDSEDY